MNLPHGTSKAYRNRGASVMSSILLVTWDGSGTFVPQRALVRALAARGHHLTVLGHESQRDDCLSDGARFMHYKRLPQWNDADPRNAHRSIREVVDSKAGGIDVREALGQVEPDVVLVDFFMREVLRAVHSARVPLIALGSTTFTSIQDSDLPPFLELADRILMFSDHLFEEILPTSEKYTYVGQLRPQTFDDSTAYNWKSCRKKIVTSFSTSFQDQFQILQLVCDTLSTLEVEALVTSGRAISPSSLAVSNNVVVERYVSHDAVLRTCDLLITHAGHGTVLAGAFYGTPMVCIPMGRDQFVNASRALKLGIARVSSMEATLIELRKTIISVLEDAEIRNRVRNISALLNSRPGVDLAVSLVEAEARTLNSPRT